MKHGRTFFQILTVAAVFFLTGGMVRAITLDEALEKLATHKFGQDNVALDFLLEAAVTSHSDPALRKKLNDGLISPRGVGSAGASYSFSVGHGQLKGNKVFKVNAVQNDGSGILSDPASL